jgi:L-fuconolactonase
MKIDAHQHFWRYTTADYGWIGDDMRVLQKDHLPPDLAPLAHSAGVEGTVAVQARQSLIETEWLLDLAGRYPLIRGVVGWVDLCSPAARDQLERFATNPKFVGVRHVVQEEPDDRFMLRDDFRRGIALLGEMGLTYDILIFPRHLPAACELAAQFPGQRFVLNHIAKPLIKAGRIAPWDHGIRRLAALPNVFCKVSGMVTEADWQAWRASDFKPYLDIVFEAFGPARLMFGSDWPVCTVAGSYERVHRLLADYTQQFSPAEQALIWGDTARTFYGLE